MSRPTLNLVQLYPRDMNIYGDWGNTLTLKRRLEWHGYDVNLIDYNLGDNFPQGKDSPDIIVGGGGQDSGQVAIAKSLLEDNNKLKRLADDDVPMLVVCGLYQLFGNFFQPYNGARIDGIGLFDCETHGSQQRLVGNTVIESLLFGTVIGYENHSGLTYLGKNTQPLGKVIKGAGNNGQDETEGAIYRNVVGTYLHGSVLPKNPDLADWLIEKAAIRKFGEFRPMVIDDQFAKLARQTALKRPR